jgi:hypothetical protein
LEKQSPWRTALKYFLHGILFSILLLVLGFVWAVIVVVLVVVGSVIGLIIGIIVLFFIVAGVNSILAELIWGMTIRTNWKNLLGHGFVLFILLIVTGIPSIVLSIVAPSLVTTIVFFVIYGFVDGLIAKEVAGYWEEKEEQEGMQTLLT